MVEIFPFRTFMFLVTFILSISGVYAQTNPFITDIYTADPSAHVFGGKMYVYPSHDKDNPNWYDMRDYHVFSSDDLYTWTDHGVVLDVDSVPWATEYMWAPDCAYKDGTYYFYFPARDEEGEFRIGVATSSSPAGPFTPEPEPIPGSFSVDPAVFIDDDGQAYMYFGGDGSGGTTTPWVAKLADNMKEFDGTPQALTGVDYWFEASYMNKINGTYYFSYSTGGYHPDYGISAIAYATSSDPMGPFTYQGIINGTVSCWTNHHSLVEYNNQWYFFYHNADLSHYDLQRSIAADYLHFGSDGVLHKVIQTQRGIGSYDGLSVIQAENYFATNSAVKEVCSEGGFKEILKNNDTLLFRKVDFDNVTPQSLELRIASSDDEGIMEVRSDNNLMSEIAINSTGGDDEWQTITTSIPDISGIKDISLRYIAPEENTLYLDWIQFPYVNAVRNIIFDKDFIVYPNPASDRLYIELPESDDPFTVSIFSTTGKRIIIRTGVKDHSEIPLDNVAPGVYFIEIRNKTSYNKDKIIVL